MELVARWVEMEIAPALWPQLFGCVQYEESGVMSGAYIELNSRSDPVRVASELGNISLDPLQEELFCQNPGPPVVGLK